MTRHISVGTKEWFRFSIHSQEVWKDALWVSCRYTTTENDYSLRVKLLHWRPDILQNFSTNSVLLQNCVKFRKHVRVSPRFPQEQVGTLPRLHPSHECFRIFFPAVLNATNSGRCLDHILQTFGGIHVWKLWFRQWLIDWKKKKTLHIAAL